MPNNNTINHPSYYALPLAGGKQLEDFIDAHFLDFSRGNALKYYWRAGHKDGESRMKDLRKCIHYCHRFAKRDEYPHKVARDCVRGMADAARYWNGRA